MHLNVVAACRLTDGPSTNVFSLTKPLRALKALLAWKWKNEDFLAVKLHFGYANKYRATANCKGSSQLRGDYSIGLKEIWNSIDLKEIWKLTLSSPTTQKTK